MDSGSCKNALPWLFPSAIRFSMNFSFLLSFDWVSLLKADFTGRAGGDVQMLRDIEGKYQREAQKAVMSIWEAARGPGPLKLKAGLSPAFN
jgi:hypothetical protein